MNNSMKKIAITVALATTVGCGTPDAPLATLPSVNIPSLPNVPDTMNDVASSKLLVAPGVKIDVPATLQRKFADEVVEVVQDSGSEVIDREMAQRFVNEIQLKENLSENYEPYQGPVEAKFAIIPTVTYYSWSSEYEKSYTTTDKKGRSTRHDPECDYKATAKGNVQIRELPSMRQVISINVSGTAYSSQENPSSRSCKNDGMIGGVINKAIGDLLDKGDDNYMTLSKYVGSQGVITGAKSYKGELYFETNLGRFHGAKKDAKVAIYQEIEGELVKIATGHMRGDNDILTRKSFIEIDDDAQPRIKRGMIVMLSGECDNFMCSIDSTIKGFTAK